MRRIVRPAGIARLATAEVALRPCRCGRRRSLGGINSSPAYGETDGADDLSGIQRDGADATRRRHDEPAPHILPRTSLYLPP